MGILLGLFENAWSFRQEYITHGLARVQHGLGPCLTFVAGTPDNLSPSELVLSGLGALITNTWSVEHLVKGELFYELSPSVRGYFKLLDEVLSITLVV